jgi:hypothetical protein
MIDGADFIEVYQMLASGNGFARRTAFGISVRVFRGGGLTKDALYLKGLLQVVRHVQDGGTLEPLFVGKIAVAHIPVIEEFKWRGILHEPPLIPAYLNREEVKQRLDAIRTGLPVWKMATRSRK